MPTPTKHATSESEAVTTADDDESDDTEIDESDDEGAADSRPAAAIVPAVAGPSYLCAPLEARLGDGDEPDWCIARHNAASDEWVMYLGPRPGPAKPRDFAGGATVLWPGGVGKAALRTPVVPRRAGAAAFSVRAVAWGSVGVPGLLLRRGRRRKVAANCEAQPPDHPSGRATTRRWRFPESVGGVASARDASRRLLVFASVLHAASLVFVDMSCFFCDSAAR